MRQPVGGAIAEASGAGATFSRHSAASLYWQYQLLSACGGIHVPCSCDGRFIRACRRLATGAHAERRIALVIGNSTYAASRRFANPKNDAELMAKTLRSVGFDVTRSSTPISAR